MTTAAHLVDVLKQLELLEPAQLGKLERALAGRSAEPRAVAAQLLEKGWLTAYQANLVLQGRAAELILGPYVLLERLGEGGMGQVFKARHRLMNRVVAVKVIRKERLAHAEAVQRFHREIRAVAQLDHPYLVRAHDAAEVGGVHFLVMEYAEGIDLAHLVQKQGPLPVGQACLYTRQAAEGLQHACECGLVHRDVKPSNLQVVGGGKAVKVLDLGLARSREPDVGGPQAELTQTCTILGTPDYIAPEQIDDPRRVDVRADIYSLGCTLYFMLAGRPPFPDGPWEEKLSRHRRAEPQPLEQIRPDVPAALGAVLRKMMAKRPDDRYPTPSAVAAALAPFASEGGPLPSTVSLPAAPAGPGSLIHERATPEAGWTLKVDSTVSRPAAPATQTAASSPFAAPTVLAAAPALPVAPSRPGRTLGKGFWIALAAGNAVLGLAVLLILLWPKGGDKGSKAEGPPQEAPRTASTNPEKGGAGDASDEPGKAPAVEVSRSRTTYEGVDYEVVSSSRDGKSWILVVAATSREGDKQVYFSLSRAITAEGKTYSDRGTMAGPVRLPEGVKIQIPMDMGRIPANVTRFVRVEVMKPRLNHEPLVLKDVTIDPTPAASGQTPPRRIPRGRP